MHSYTVVVTIYITNLGYQSFPFPWRFSFLRFSLSALSTAETPWLLSGTALDDKCGSRAS